MANNNGAETYEFYRKIKTSGHGKLTKQQAKALKDKWNAKIYGKNDSDNGDNYVHVVTPP
jgi:hypothetical protein